MRQADFSDEFKRDAVAHITERGYRVAEVSERLGVTQHSLYARKRQLAKVVAGDAGKGGQSATRIHNRRPSAQFPPAARKRSTAA